MSTKRRLLQVSHANNIFSRKNELQASPAESILSSKKSMRPSKHAKNIFFTKGACGHAHTHTRKNVIFHQGGLDFGTCFAQISSIPSSEVSTYVAKRRKHQHH